MDEADELLAERPERCPTHPGVVLRDTVLPAIRMTVKDAAAELRVSRQMLHRILGGEVSISPQMAVRLGKFCGNGPDCGFGCSRRMTFGKRSVPFATSWN